MRTNFLVASGLAPLLACGALLDLEPLRFEDRARDAGGVRSTPDAKEAPTAPADADAPPVCTAAVDFCDDFERVAPLQGDWSSRGTAGSGMIRIQDGVLLASLTRGDGGGTGHSAALTLEKAWPTTDAGARRRLSIQFRAKLDVCPAATQAFVSFVTVGLGQTSVGLEVGRDSDDDCIARLQEIYVADPDSGVPQYYYSPPRLVTTGVWADYDLEVPETPPDGRPLATMQIGAERSSLLLQMAPPIPTLYQLFGVSQGTLAGADVAVSLDDFRIVYAR